MLISLISFLIIVNYNNYYNILLLLYNLYYNNKFDSLIKKLFCVRLDFEYNRCDGYDAQKRADGILRTCFVAVRLSRENETVSIGAIMIISFAIDDLQALFLFRRHSKSQDSKTLILHK